VSDATRTPSVDQKAVMSAHCDLANPLEAGSVACPRCLALWQAGALWLEMVRPLPECAPPLDVTTAAPHCHDCAAADSLVRRSRADPRFLAYLTERSQPVRLSPTPDDDFEEGEEDRGDEGVGGISWVMGRVAVGNDRLEQYRLPGVPLGLAHPSLALVRPSAAGDGSKIRTWLVDLGLASNAAALCRGSAPTRPVRR